MLLIAGIVPDEDQPLVMGTVVKEGADLIIDGHQIPCTQGTAAMLGAALAVTTYLNTESPKALLIGDTGKGKGSKDLYDYLIKNINTINPDVLALHYWMPNIYQMQDLMEAIQTCSKTPVLIADAASMYAAKAAGLAHNFDFFTPDASEMAFLADPEAIHPAYINKHLFRADISKTPELVKAAYEQQGSAKNLLVKGEKDYIVIEGEITDIVSLPNIPELECIGGTGDTITGMLAALVDAGIDFFPAAMISAKANRAAGEKAHIDPASSVSKIIDKLPEVFKENLCSWSGYCINNVK